MRPVWLIEAGVYGEDADPLLAEIRRQGMPVTAVPFSALRSGAMVTIGSRALRDGDCVIGFGTPPFVQQIQLHQRWLPGAWCQPTNLDCATYYAHYGKYLLNEQYALLPVGEAVRMQDWLFKVFATNGSVFVRPTSCHKTFSGRTVSQGAFAAVLGPARCDPANLVVVAAPREIGREWRLVIAEDRVIAACQYARRGLKTLASICPTAVRDFAETMLAEVRWTPDPIFMMDVCEAEDGLRLIELNGFSTSWFYRCDLRPIVRTATELARKAWEDAQEEDVALVSVQQE